MLLKTNQNHTLEYPPKEGKLSFTHQHHIFQIHFYSSPPFKFSSPFFLFNFSLLSFNVLFFMNTLLSKNEKF